MIRACREHKNMMRALAELTDAVPEELAISVASSVLMYTTMIEVKNKSLEADLEKSEKKLAKIEYSRHKK